MMCIIDFICAGLSGFFQGSKMHKARTKWNLTVRRKLGTFVRIYKDFSYNYTRIWNSACASLQTMSISIKKIYLLLNNGKTPNLAGYQFIKKKSQFPSDTFSSQTNSTLLGEKIAVVHKKVTSRKEMFFIINIVLL